MPWQGRTKAWAEGLARDRHRRLRRLPRPGRWQGRTHHDTAVTPAGKRAFDKRLPDAEPKLRELFAELKAEHGRALVVVHQPASIGVLPLAVARDVGGEVAYLPVLTTRRTASGRPRRAEGPGEGRGGGGDSPVPPCRCYVRWTEPCDDLRIRAGGPLLSRTMSSGRRS
ncbi:IS110 family transposase [Streptomyces pulveraceus]|uniref:Transposase n=1 Tax=Streptomyces pulveraceus TaxID=68258 RepID=A0ABW1GVT7_9ACTN